MFAMLGNIRFDAVSNGITSVSHNKSVRYATHEVFKSKPRLQKIAENSDDLSLNVGLHRKSGNVQARIDAIEALMDKQEPVCYMKGDGRMVGNFVVESMGIYSKVEDDLGGLVEADISLYLREFSGEMDNRGTLSGLTNSGLGALGSVVANVNEAMGLTANLFDNINGLLNGAFNAALSADSLTSSISQLRTAQDGMQMLNDMQSTLQIGQGHLVQFVDSSLLYNDFISAATAMLASFDHVEQLRQDSLTAGTIVAVDVFESVSRNITSQASSLRHERLSVLAQLGMRAY